MQKSKVSMTIIQKVLEAIEYQDQFKMTRISDIAIGIRIIPPAEHRGEYLMDIDLYVDKARNVVWARAYAYHIPTDDLKKVECLEMTYKEFQKLGYDELRMTLVGAYLELQALL